MIDLPRDVTLEWTWTDAIDSCRASGKRMYDSSRQARAALRGMNRNRRRGRTESEAYLCDACNAWHVTSAGGRR